MARVEIATSSPRTIDRLIGLVRRKEKELKIEQSRQVTNYAVEYAKRELRQFLGGRGSEVIDGIKPEFDPKTGEGKVISTHPASSFVEYGTGTKGVNSPHPSGVHKHGYRAGWWPFYYERYDVWFMTEGQVSKPYMFNTYMHLRDMFGK